jgi:hypothetical protein
MRREGGEGTKVKETDMRSCQIFYKPVEAKPHSPENKLMTPTEFRDAFQ